MTAKAAQVHRTSPGKWHLVARERRNRVGVPVRMSACHRELHGDWQDAVGVHPGDRCAHCHGWPG